MILHIFKKDVRLLWPYAVGLALAGYLSAAMAVGREGHGVGINQLWPMLELLKVLGAGCLVAVAVHQDAVPGVRQDWLVRPIARRDLILAKVLFVVVMVQLPVIFGDVVELLTLGFGPARALGAALLRGAMLFGLYLPVMALASITKNLMEGVVAAVAGFVGFSMLAQTWGAAARGTWRYALVSSTGAEWIAELGMIGVVALGGAAILAFQYMRRRTLPARWLAAGVGLLCFAVNLIPWQPVFAIQRSLSAQPGAAKGVQLAFQRERGRARNNDVSSFPMRTAVTLPVGFSGVEAGSIVRTDLLEARLTTSDGKVEKVGVGTARLEVGDGTARGGSYSTFFVPVPTFERLRDREVRVELEYSLTLLRLRATHAMAAVNGRQRIAEFGRCETRIRPYGTDVELMCNQPAMTPPCARVWLEHAPTGKRNPEVTMCAGSYAPFSMQAEPGTLRRLQIGLAYRETSGPVGERDLGESQVVSRWYDAAEHFSRKVEIAGLKLGDWRVR